MTHAEDAFEGAVAKHYPKLLRRTNADGVRDEPYNVLLYLQGEEALRELLAMDQFMHRIVKLRVPPWPSAGAEWSEHDTVMLRLYLAEQFSANFSTVNVEHAVIRAATDQAYHPVREYLEALTWDGTERVPYWLGAYLDATRGASDDLRGYIYTVGRMWLVAAVARVFEPGCKFDNVLILEGPQGVGKSTALAILGGEWFTDTPFRIGEKDSYQALQGKWLVELPELENFSGVDASRAKAFFSSGQDNYRPSYGRRNQVFPRQCVFAGTTNQGEYFKDSTGNRRYWPVRVHRLDREAIACDRDQLWAEAVHLYRQGARFHLAADDPLWAVFAAEQELREVCDPWELAIRDWLASPDRFAREDFTLYDVLHWALGVDVNRMDRRSMAVRVGMILSRLGYSKHKATTREGRRNGGYFYRKRVSPEGDQA